MNEIRYDNVSVLLVDQNLSMRRLMRSSLNTIGFEVITECRNMDNLLEVLNEEEADLLILDLDTETERVCQEIKSIRSGALGGNPFVVVIALTWLPEKDVVHLTLTSGADDVVTKPVSTKVLMDRVNNLIQNRKDFVVTTNYIGPERRAKPRRPANDLPTIQAPNTMRSKAIGDESLSVTKARIGEALRQVKVQKAYRLASLIGTRTVALLERANKYRNTPVPRDQLHDLRDLVVMLSNHVAKERLDNYSGIVASMSTVTEELLNTVVPTIQQLEILRIHSQAIAALIIGNDSATDLITKALQAAADVARSTPEKIDKAS